jgi:hypothetical protein
MGDFEMPVLSIQPTALTNKRYRNIQSENIYFHSKHSRAIANDIVLHMELSFNFYVIAYISVYE